MNSMAVPYLRGCTKDWADPAFYGHWLGKDPGLPAGLWERLSLLVDRLSKEHMLEVYCAEQDPLGASLRDQRL